MGEEQTEITTTAEETASETTAEETATETTAEEPEKQNTLPAEPTVEQENSERSQLGRRVSGIENSMSQMQESMTEFIASMKEQNRQKTEQEIPFEIATTQEELATQVREITGNDKETAAQTTQKYQDSYMKAFNKEGVNEPDFDGIVQEMYTNFNTIHSENGKNDAKLNFYKAKASLLAKKQANLKINPLKGDPPKTPLENKDKGHILPNVKKQTVLSGAALAYANSCNMSEESRQDAINKPMPIHLTKQ